MVPPAQAPTDIKKKKGKEAGDDGTIQGSSGPRDASAPSLGVDNENENTPPLVQVTTCKSIEVQEMSSDRVVRVSLTSPCGHTQNVF